MVNLLLTNDNLEKFISGLDISEEEKSSLILKVPQLSEEERIELLATLKDVYLLDIEQQQAVEKLKSEFIQ